jgi:succinate-semialdehyde dehydrogenase/glutarate-semialdehyde dehydrogenase
MSIQTINPYTNETVKSFEEITEKILDDKVAKAQEAFVNWRVISYEDRANLLHKVATLMRVKKSALAKTITLEMGKLLVQAEGEIDLSADIIDYYADHGEAFLKDKVLDPEYGSAIIRNSPIGVLLGIMPWNFPYYQVARFAAPNIMVGNTILLKHASIVPQCAVAIEELFEEAEAPEGLYTNLFISGKRSSALVSDKRIKGISFTGSEEAGASIAMEAGKHLKKVVLELGGNDVFVILEDADIEKTVEWAVVGRMNNNGQCCVASKRFIAVEAIAETFIQKFKDKLSKMKVGDPMDPDTELGPLSSEEAAVHLADQVKRSIDEGATVLLGGKRSKREGAFMEPTILTDLKPGIAAYHEELFGPVASFYIVKDEQARLLLILPTILILVWVLLSLHKTLNVEKK